MQQGGTVAFGVCSDTCFGPNVKEDQIINKLKRGTHRRSTFRVGVVFVVIFLNFALPLPGRAETRNAEASIFEQLAQQALSAVWGKAVDIKGNPLTPKSESERTTIPMPPADVERVIRGAAIVGEAIWCGLDWQPQYLRFMQAERRRNSLTDVQAAYTGILFGLTQQTYAQALAANGKCSTNDREATGRKLELLGK